MCLTHFDGWVGLLGKITVLACVSNAVDLFPAMSQVSCAGSICGRTDGFATCAGLRWLDLE
jgi:hypothetical protein